MNLAKPFRAFIGAVALLGMTVAPFAQGTDITPDTKTEVQKKVSELLSEHAYVPALDFNQWQSFLQNEQPKIDAATTNEDFARAINEALTKFGASHIYLATPRAAETRRNASMVGIGISQQTTPDGVVVVRAIPGAPADKAGLVPGDLITKVDGQKAEGTKGIPGAEGTTVKLTVRHQNGKEQDYTVTRAKFSTVRPEELTEVDKDTAKLTIYTFDWTYSRDNVETLMKKAQAYKNLILDLRDNGGGAVVNLQQLLGFFIGADDPVGTFVNKQMVNAFVKSTSGKPSEVVKIAEWSRNRDDWDFQQIRALHSSTHYKGHVVVLINGFSGSASEICGAALHDLIGATLVGQKSAGAVLVSVIVPASNKFTLQYPIMDYVTIHGVRLEGTGLTPQVAVEDDKKPRLPNGPDLAVEKALALFAREKLREDRSINR